MNEERFLKERKPEWQRLEAYAQRLEGRGAALSGKELAAFVTIYRKTVGDLARARVLNVRPQVVEYLNGLVGRVHLQVYTTKPYPIGKILDFYRATLPRTVRALKRHVLAAAALLLLPAVAGFVAVERHPALATSFAPAGYGDQLEESFGKKFGTQDRDVGMKAVMHSFYIVNNIQVSFWSFALGIFFGLGSAFFLSFNGLVLGGVAALVKQHGYSYNFWSFVASHGGIELGAIVLSGAAGLRLGLALVNPGMVTRKASLTLGARDAGVVMGGVVTLLLAAAAIEAWISPSTLPNPVKLTLGAVNLCAFLAYLTLAGRGQK